MKFVRLLDSTTVVEIFDELPIFHPDVMATIFQAPDEVDHWWIWNGEAYVPPPPAEEPEVSKEEAAWDRVRKRLIEEELAKGE